ncbi:hypothetical protein [Phaeobacter sp. B1627]|uniref:type I restriction endonuclease subunit R, EcoR124 family n=1 Tax=Phaeobacter sp. B1627 TaxID=2583809 RepID=UPI002105A79D|nr:hypothetical protein [Phaeobacter sp. B1627]
MIEAFFAFAQAEQRREAEELITEEKLNADAAKRYIATSIKREYARETGTELNSILPKMSPLNPQYLTKKRDVFQRISAFVEKFKGVGGKCRRVHDQWSRTTAYQLWFSARVAPACRTSAAKVQF